MHAVSLCSSRGFGGHVRTRFFRQPLYDSPTPGLASLLEASDWQFALLFQSVEARPPSVLFDAAPSHLAFLPPFLPALTVLPCKLYFTSVVATHQ